MKSTNSRHEKLNQILWITSGLAGLLSLVLGLLVLIVWHVGSRTLVQVMPTFVPMQYNTALAFRSLTVT